MVERKRRIRALVELLFPPKCAACSQLISWNSQPWEALCPTCQKEWDSEKKDTCSICSREICQCNCVTAEMRKARCAGLYRLVFYRQNRSSPVQNRLIYHLKQQRDPRAEAFIAKELQPMLQRLMLQEGILPQRCTVTYLPRATSPRLQSGTDQAKEIARALADELEISWERLIQRKLWRGKRQKRLSFAGRLKNAKDTYRIKKGTDLQGRDVLLVDDIVTSGAGMAVCTRLLRRAGAGRVFCVSVAIDDIQREGDGPPLESAFASIQQ